MKHGIIGIDHPVIAVRDLRAARAAYERLGFTVPPRGSHLEWGTGNWCILFERDYLELRGITDPAKYTHGLERFLEKREGLMGVALGTNDAGASFDSLVAARLHPAPVRQLTRSFELPEGNVLPRFALCFLDEPETPGMSSVVLCQHLTPELLRKPEWLVHANGAQRASSITVVVRDVRAVNDAYQRLFGTVIWWRTDEALSVQLGNDQEIVVTTADHALRRHPGIQFTARDECPVAVSIDVSDLAVTEALLSSHGVSLVAREGRTLHVAPEEACGVALEFRAQVEK